MRYYLMKNLPFLEPFFLLHLNTKCVPQEKGSGINDFFRYIKKYFFIDHWIVDGGRMQ